MSNSDTQEGGEYDLHSNVCYDLVQYIRSNTIRNEQTFLLTVLGYITGAFEEPEHYISGVLIGTPGGGKTHVKKQVDNLFDFKGDDDILYQTTSGSSKSIVYDEEWDSSLIASLDEVQKLDSELVELLKGVHGGDEGHTYKVTTGSVEKGFETEEHHKKPLPVFLTFAQHEWDQELFDRLLKIPVHESESKNKMVGAMEFNHDHISIDDEIEYGYGFNEGTRAIKGRIKDILYGTLGDSIPGYVYLPAGEEYDWDVWEIVEPIFNHNRSESNRIYSMVANLIRASAILNYPERDVETVYDTRTGTREAIIADPQDVANVLGCRETLVSTTHNLDDKRWTICEAIKNNSGMGDEVEGIGPIVEYMKTSDAPIPPESELEQLIEDLADNYLIQIHEESGDRGQDIYEFLGWDELGFARVPEQEGLFADTFDPISGRNFVEVHHELRDRLESRGSDMIADAETAPDTDTSPSGAGSGPGSLSDFGAGGGLGVDLEPHEETVRAAMKEHLDGERVEDMTEVPVEGLIGLTDHADPNTNVVVDGSLLDPDNAVWSQPDKDDSWVTSVKDARREVRRAIKKLVGERVISYQEVFERNPEGQPIDAIVSVAGEDDL